MDCDVDLAKFTEHPYVVERPATGCFADLATDMLARAGLRLAFGDDAQVVNDHDAILTGSLPPGTGLIGRTGTRLGNGASTTLVSGTSSPSRYASSSNPAVETAFGGLVMIGHSLAGPDRGTAIAFGSLMAMRAGATKDTLMSISARLSDESASLAWNAAAKIPAYVEACRPRLENSATFATATAVAVERNARIIAAGALKTEYRRHAAPGERLLADLRNRMGDRLGLASEGPSGADRLSTELGDRNTGPSKDDITRADQPSFEVRPFNVKHFGPSYLPLHRFNRESLRVVQGLHPDLLKVVARASDLSEQDFQVVPGNGGMRTPAMQKKLKAKGASRAKLGRHTFGYAIDLVPVDEKGRVDFKNLAGFDEIMRSMKAASEELGIPVEWGGNWKSLVDKPHFELNRKVYPGPNEKAKPGDVLVAFK